MTHSSSPRRHLARTLSALLILASATATSACGSPTPRDSSLACAPALAKIEAIDAELKDHLDAVAGDYGMAAPLMQDAAGELQAVADGIDDSAVREAVSKLASSTAEVATLAERYAKADGDQAAAVFEQGVEVGKQRRANEDALRDMCTPESPSPGEGSHG